MSIPATIFNSKVSCFICAKLLFHRFQFDHTAKPHRPAFHACSICRVGYCNDCYREYLLTSELVFVDKKSDTFGDKRCACCQKDFLLNLNAHENKETIYFFLRNSRSLQRTYDTALTKLYVASAHPNHHGKYIEYIGYEKFSQDVIDVDSIIYDINEMTLSASFNSCAASISENSDLPYDINEIIAAEEPLPDAEIISRPDSDIPMISIPFAADYNLDLDGDDLHCTQQLHISDFLSDDVRQLTMNEEKPFCLYFSEEFLEKKRKRDAIKTKRNCLNKFNN